MDEHETPTIAAVAAPAPSIVNNSNVWAQRMAQQKPAVADKAIAEPTDTKPKQKDADGFTPVAAQKDQQKKAPVVTRKPKHQQQQPQQQQPTIDIESTTPASQQQDSTPAGPAPAKIVQTTTRSEILPVSSSSAPSIAPISAWPTLAQVPTPTSAAGPSSPTHNQQQNQPTAATKGPWAKMDVDIRYAPPSAGGVNGNGVAPKKEGKDKKKKSDAKRNHANKAKAASAAAVANPAAVAEGSSESATPVTAAKKDEAAESAVPAVTAEMAAAKLADASSPNETSAAPHSHQSASNGRGGAHPRGSSHPRGGSSSRGTNSSNRGNYNNKRHSNPNYYDPMMQGMNPYLFARPVAPMRNGFIPLGGVPGGMSGPLPGPGPIDPNSVDLETVRNWIKWQIEFYFSIENLCHDMYFRSHMNPASGVVPLRVIAGFNRIRSFTTVGRIKTQQANALAAATAAAAAAASNETATTPAPPTPTADPTDTPTWTIEFIQSTLTTSEVVCVLGGGYVPLPAVVEEVGVRRKELWEQWVMQPNQVIGGFVNAPVGQPVFRQGPAGSMG
ncbi:hypothetical protein HDU98_000670, partial [Podochytrium sp. JEL0797]